MESTGYATIFENAISESFRSIMRKLFSHPAHALTLMNIYRSQKSAAKIRNRFHHQRISIPPVAIFSITENCNLRCKGCYAACKSVQSKQSVTSQEFCDAISNLSQHGIRIVMIAGGEPFTCNWLTENMKKYKDVLFIVFTNGLFLDSQTIGQLKRGKNIVPVISVEGDREQTDDRRGKGVYDKIISACAELSEAGHIFGFSHTVSASNVDFICSEQHIGQLMKYHPRVFFNVEYVPIAPDTEHLVLSEADRQRVIESANEFRKRFNALFITMPGDEEQWGGCLAAGRGFFHINPAGDIEPCPFAAMSPGNIFNTPLLSLLQSEMFVSIRENHHLLTETSGGCALWNNKDLIPALVQHSKQ